MSGLKALYYINQFYAGIGGEEMAHTGLNVYDEPKGPAVGMEALWNGEMKVVKTVSVGDNFINTDSDYESIKDEMLRIVKEADPDVIVAGPAFNAGRYGVACGKFCKLIKDELGIPVVTSMFESNPAVPMYVKDICITYSAEKASGMRTSLPDLARIALKLAKGEALLPADEEGYMPTGHRNNVLDEKSDAVRTVDLLMKKLKGEPYKTEVPIRQLAKVPAAPPIKDFSKIKIGFVTTGGLVPKGNPDKIRQYAAESFGIYPIDPATFTAENYESVHGGYDTTLVNQNPQRLVPYKAAMKLFEEGKIGEVDQCFLATCGIGTNVEMAAKLGAQMAKVMLDRGVQAVFLTST